MDARTTCINRVVGNGLPANGAGGLGPAIPACGAGRWASLVRSPAAGLRHRDCSLAPFGPWRLNARQAPMGHSLP